MFVAEQDRFRFSGEVLEFEHNLSRIELSEGVTEIPILVSRRR